MNQKPDHFNEWDVYKYRYKTLVEPGFTLSYTKARYLGWRKAPPSCSRACFKPPEDRRKAAALIGEATWQGRPEPDTSSFMDSVGDGRSPKKVYLDPFNCPKPEGYDDGWFKD